MKIVFVHGAFVRDGAWWWQPVATRLQRDRGVASTAVILPSCREDPATSAGTEGLREDAAALRRVLDETLRESEGEAGCAVVVAHSYGGTVLAEAGQHRAMRHLVYISSFLPLIGQTHASLGTSSSDPVPVRPGPGGTLSLIDDDADVTDRRFLHDVTDPVIRRQAHARLCPQSGVAFTTPTTAAAWQSVESTYLVCAEDRNTDPALQRRHAARATRTVELPASHHPFLSRPGLVARHLDTILTHWT